MIFPREFWDLCYFLSFNWKKNIVVDEYKRITGKWISSRYDDFK